MRTVFNDANYKRNNKRNYKLKQKHNNHNNSIIKTPEAIASYA